MSYQFNSKTRPTEFPHQFDAHIYFTEKQIPQLHKLRELILANFKSEQVFVGDMIPVLAGPHTLPMMEVNFIQEVFSDFVLFLVKHRQDLSILVHTITGDDLYDHTQGAIWLGEQVPLDYSRL